MRNDTNNTAAHYAAFISYAHKDEAISARLHRALETYRVPKNLHDTANALKPIFRDVAELSAAHSLSEKIQDAVRRSRFLIVLCSPAAKASHWVNEEIKLFRAEHGDARILCALAEGTPETAFPEALLEDGREPLAANLAGDKAAFRLGVTQLAATMLDTNLDTLIQRDAKRRLRKFQTAMAASLAVTGVMGVMTFAAVDARQEAEKRRGDAEGLIEFMLTDLKDKLEPVGKLDALEVVGTKASDYYDSYDLSDHDDDSLGRRARVYHYLGEIKYSQGQIAEAIDYFDKAYRSTEALLARSPNNPDRIFDHAQSAFWRATPMYRAGKYDEAKPYIQDYVDLAERLNAIEPETVRGLQEPGYAYQNMAVLLHRQSKFDLAESLFKKAYDVKTELGGLYPESINYQFGVAETLSWLAEVERESKRLQAARKTKDKEIGIYLSLLAKDPNNRKVQYELFTAYNSAVDIHQELGAEDRALDFQEKSLKIISTLHSLDPDNLSWVLDYIKSQQKGVRFLIGQSQLDMAEIKLQKLKPTLEMLERSLNGEATDFVIQKDQFTFLQTAIAILSGNFYKADTLAKTYFDRNFLKNEDSAEILKSGMHNYLICVRAIINKRSDGLDRLISRYDKAGLNKDTSWGLRYLRAQASRDFIQGNSVGLDKYLEQETFLISQQVFTALRDGKY